MVVDDLTKKIPSCRSFRFSKICFTEILVRCSTSDKFSQNVQKSAKLATDRSSIDKPCETASLSFEVFAVSSVRTEKIPSQDIIGISLKLIIFHDSYNI